MKVFCSRSFHQRASVSVSLFEACGSKQEGNDVFLSFVLLCSLWKSSFLVSIALIRMIRSTTTMYLSSPFCAAVHTEHRQSPFALHILFPALVIHSYKIIILVMLIKADGDCFFGHLNLQLPGVHNQDSLSLFLSSLFSCMFTVLRMTSQGMCLHCQLCLFALFVRYSTAAFSLRALL